MGPRYWQQRWRNAFHLTQGCKWDLGLSSLVMLSVVKQTSKNSLYLRMFPFYPPFQRGIAPRVQTAFWQTIEASDLSFIRSHIRRSDICGCGVQSKPTWRTSGNHHRGLQPLNVNGVTGWAGPPLTRVKSAAQSRRNFPRLHSCPGFESAKRHFH